MGKLSRDKGKGGEREVAALLRDHGFAGKRGVQYQGGRDSADVLGLPGHHIEVKRTEKFDLYGALEQARGDSGGASVPVVFHRKNGKDWVVVLPAEHFLIGVSEDQKLRDTLQKMANAHVNPPVIVKDQPDDRDWEKLKADNARLRRRVDELEGLITGDAGFEFANATEQF